VREPSSPLIGLAGAIVWGQVLAVALVIDPTALENFRLPKLLLAELLALLSLILLVLAWPSRPGTSGRAWLRQPAVRVAVPLLIAGLASTLASSHPDVSWPTLGSLSLALAALVAWSAWLPRLALRRALDALVAAAVVLAVLALLQATGTFQLYEFADRQLSGRLAIVSLAGNVGDLAMFLVLPLLVALARALEPRVPAVRTLWIVATLLILAGLLAIATFTALASATAGVAAGAIVLARRRPRTIVLALLAPVVALLIAAATVKPIRSRVELAADALRQGAWNDVVSGRFGGWRMAFEMARREPLLGVGLGAFGREFLPTKLALLDSQRLVLDRWSVAFDKAHNDYLQWVAETGGAGGVALVVALVSLVGALRRRAQQAEGSEAALLAAGPIAIATLALANFPLGIALTGWPAVAFLAWAIAPAPVEGQQVAPAPRLVMVLGLSLLFTVRFLDARDRIIASRLVKAAQVTTLRAAAAHAPPAVYQRNLNVLAEAERRVPGDLAILMTQAAQHLLLGQPQAATRIYRRVLAIEPRPEAYLNLGRAQTMEGLVPEARASLRMAIRLDSQLAVEAEKDLARLEAASGQGQ
jgi:O-antigen ligase